MKPRYVEVTPIERVAALMPGLGNITDDDRHKEDDALSGIPDVILLHVTVVAPLILI